MSASSSDDDVVGPGAGGCAGSALAVPIAKADSPIDAPAKANHIHRIGTPFLLPFRLIPGEASTRPHPPHAQRD
jgi:hypothetical protein